jgi:hypothetical protein
MNQIPERKCLFAVKKTKESFFVLVVCLFVFLFFFVVVERKVWDLP